MARAAIPGRLSWRLAEVEAVRAETPTVRTIALQVPGWPGHEPGQHLDVRLTAPDGYQAQRSYSIASAPDAGEKIELTVERLPDGEVSGFLVDELRPGDRIELRGPVGGYFVWDGDAASPLLLVAGGSGIVPLMAMLRFRAAIERDVPTRLLLSSRTIDDVIYRDELARLAAARPGLEVFHTLTRSSPPGWSGFTRRIDAAMLREIAWPPARRPLAFVCGPTALVESVAAALVEQGHDPGCIRTERFGPTGG
ncbi:MAG: ferredoxin reductase [Candidatus Dormibacteraeota bacterium]|nr:ferredoxin reductase [Candidatus Dormibacteraeota bacterium]